MTNFIDAAMVILSVIVVILCGLIWGLWGFKR